MKDWRHAINLDFGSLSRRELLEEDMYSVGAGEDPRVERAGKTRPRDRWLGRKRSVTVLSVM